MKIKKKVPKLTSIEASQRSKYNHHKSSWIFSSIHQMREGFLRITVTSKALSETNPSWDTIDYRTNIEILLHAHRWVSRCHPVISVCYVETCQKLVIHQSCYKGVKLITQPEISETHMKERGREHAELRKRIFTFIENYYKLLESLSTSNLLPTTNKVNCETTKYV